MRTVGGGSFEDVRLERLSAVLGVMVEAAGVCGEETCESNPSWMSGLEGWIPHQF